MFTSIFFTWTISQTQGVAGCSSEGKKLMIKSGIFFDTVLYLYKDFTWSPDSLDTAGIKKRHYLCSLFQTCLSSQHSAPERLWSPSDLSGPHSQHCCDCLLSFLSLCHGVPSSLPNELHCLASSGAFTVTNTHRVVICHQGVYLFFTYIVTPCNADLQQG